MMMMINREPDVILPEVENDSVRINLWIEEELFSFGYLDGSGQYKSSMKHIITPGIPRDITPLQYLKALAEGHGYIESHAYIAMNYFADLEIEKVLTEDR